MKLQTSFGLECGDIIKETKDYYWHTDNRKENDIQMSKYESFINFNKPGNKLYCNSCHDYRRIKRISVYTVEFDVGDFS